HLHGMVGLGGMHGLACAFVETALPTSPLPVTLTAPNPSTSEGYGRTIVTWRGDSAPTTPPTKSTNSWTKYETTRGSPGELRHAVPVTGTAVGPLLTRSIR